MMPIPPTRRETEAMLARSIVRICVVAVAALARSAWFRIEKSSASYGAILCRILSSSVISVCATGMLDGLVAEIRICLR